jgi:ribosomal-protein-alanine N-acetyltransferase
MNLEDVAGVHLIETQSFSVPWSENAFIEEMTTNMLAIYHVAVLDGGIVGYAGMWEVIDELHITNIAVEKAFRGRGIGNALMKYIIEYGYTKGFHAMTLEVRRGNLSAISLYEKYDFEVLGVRKEYYTDNHEDALVMWKELK